MHRITLVLAALLAAPAQAAPAPRSFDLVTYTAPDGFKVEAQGDHVMVSRVGSKSYCLIAIYSSADASADLDASFASEWSDLVNRAVDPIAVPANQHATVAGAPAAIGAAMTTSGGKPVLAMLTTIDAGAKVVSIFVMTPNQDDLKVYTPSIAALMNSLIVKRVEPAAAPSAPSAPSGGTAWPANGTIDVRGKIKVPFAPRLKLSDLDGEWIGGDNAVTGYVSASTGAYAGASSIQSESKWMIDSKSGTAKTDFHGATWSSSSGASVSAEHFVKKISLAPNGDLYIVPKQSDGVPEHYLVGGWQVTPDYTVMVLVGRYFDPDGIPQRTLADPNAGYANLYIRMNKVK